MIIEDVIADYLAADRLLADEPILSRANSPIGMPQPGSHDHRDGTRQEDEISAYAAHLKAAGYARLAAELGGPHRYAILSRLAQLTYMRMDAAQPATDGAYWIGYVCRDASVPGYLPLEREIESEQRHGTAADAWRVVARLNARRDRSHLPGGAVAVAWRPQK